MGIVSQIIEFINRILSFVASIMFTVSILASCIKILGFELFEWETIIRMIVLSGFLTVVVVCLCWLELHI